MTIKKRFMPTHYRKELLKASKIKVRIKTSGGVLQRDGVTSSQDWLG